jgi:hypothetical protein
MIKDEALKLALEALETIAKLTGARWALEQGYAGHLEAITEIRQALAAQPAQQEPVGEVTRYGLDSHGRKWHGIHWYDPNVDVAHGTKLYTTPPAPQRKPLMDEQISQLWEGHVVPVFGKNGINPIVFARAIEAAHGITGENT